jgi:glucose/arabinose dehydrogenase
VRGLRRSVAAPTTGARTATVLDLMIRLFAAAMALALGAGAQTVPTGFTVDALLSTGLSRPTDLCFLPDGRALVANLAGDVTVYAGGAFATIGSVPSVFAGGEQGLLSIAADPQFAANGFVYVWYTSSLDAAMHLDRFQLQGVRNAPTSTALTLDLASRTVVLDALPNNGAAHNGGSLRFGPDGLLYVSAGDDLDACGARSPSSGVGCLLRLDVANLPATPSLAAPSFALLDPGNNPLSAASDVSQLVIAHGLRNPFRMEIDPATGSLYVADVGETTAEELNEFALTGGPVPLRDFGWSDREGDQPWSPCPGIPPGSYVDPILSVAHSASNWRSIVAGPRYRNPASGGFGAAYDGDVFVCDYFAGDLRRLTPGPNGWSDAPPVAGQPDAQRWAAGFPRPSALRQGPDGCLWLLDNSFFGRLLRIRRQAPQSALLATGGDGQRTAAGEAFAAPLVVRAFDALGQPAAGVTVLFGAQGGAALLSPALATTDAQGFAQATAVATAGGGGGSVTATNLATGASTSFALFGRRLAVAHAAPTLTLAIDNATAANPQLVPFVVLTSFPGSPTLPSPIGPLCIDPSYPLAIVLEDGVGAFGGVSLSGGTGIGTPSLTAQYIVPTGLLGGQLMRFLAVGIDPIDGPFRTNCASFQF